MEHRALAKAFDEDLFAVEPIHHGHDHRVVAHEARGLLDGLLEMLMLDSDEQQVDWRLACTRRLVQRINDINIDRLAIDPPWLQAQCLGPLPRGNERCGERWHLDEMTRIDGTHGACAEDADASDGG